MRQAIPAGTRHQPPATAADHGASVSGENRGPNGVDPASDVVRMVSENALIVIGTRGCCMCHVVKRLLQGLGANPPLYEVDERYEADVARELSRKIIGDDAGMVLFPAVFVGGKLFGGLEKVMATHISGELVPILKDVGALWL